MSDTCTCGNPGNLYDDDVFHRWDGNPCFHMTCPECGGKVERIHTCHTWGWRPNEEGKMVGGMSCIGCCSAMHYYCTERYEEVSPCRWEYTAGMNPNNPKAAENEKRKPAWLEGLEEDGIW